MTDLAETGVILDVLEERKRQDAKFGKLDDRTLDMLEWWAILSEEFGEVAREVCEYHWPASASEVSARLTNIRDELIQVAAVSVAMVQVADKALKNATLIGG